MTAAVTTRCGQCGRTNAELRGAGITFYIRAQADGGPICAECAA